MNKTIINESSLLAMDYHHMHPQGMYPTLGRQLVWGSYSVLQTVGLVLPYNFSPWWVVVSFTVLPSGNELRVEVVEYNSMTNVWKTVQLSSDMNCEKCNTWLIWPCVDLSVDLWPCVGWLYELVIILLVQS